MKLPRRLFGLALAATATIGLALPANAQEQSVIETIKQDGVIRIGLSLFVPWSMRDKNGDLIGYELDVGPPAGRGHGRRGRVCANRLGWHHPGTGFGQF